MSRVSGLKSQWWGGPAVMLVALLLCASPGRCWAASGPVAKAPVAAPVAAPADSLENSPLQLPPPGGSPVSTDSPTGNSGDAGSATSSGAMRVAAALGAVIALILILRWVGQRALANGAVRGGKSAAVRVLSRTILAPKQQVLLLHVGKRIVVVGDSGGRMSPLCEIAEPDEVAALVGASQSVGCESAKAVFGSVFRRAKEPFSDQDEPTDPADVLAVTQSDEPSDVAEPAPVDNLLDRVRLMRNQFKGA